MVIGTRFLVARRSPRRVWMSGAFILIAISPELSLRIVFFSLLGIRKDLVSIVDSGKDFVGLLLLSSGLESVWMVRQG